MVAREADAWQNDFFTPLCMFKCQKSSNNYVLSYPIFFIIFLSWVYLSIANMALYSGGNSAVFPVWSRGLQGVLKSWNTFRDTRAQEIHTPSVRENFNAWKIRRVAKKGDRTWIFIFF